MTKISTIINSSNKFIKISLEGKKWPMLIKFNILLINLYAINLPLPTTNPIINNNNSIPMLNITLKILNLQINSQCAIPKASGPLASNNLTCLMVEVLARISMEAIITNNRG